MIDPFLTELDDIDDDIDKEYEHLFIQDESDEEYESGSEIENSDAIHT